MKPKTMILMVVAIVCGLGASYMTSRLLAEREDQPVAEAPPPPPKVKVLVAKKSLSIGKAIKKPQDLFIEKDFDPTSVPKDAITDWKQLENKTARHTLREGFPVLPDDLKEGPATLEVPPGMRAVGLPVTVATTAGGFASLPGSHVDIIWNMRGNSPDQTFSLKLLQNVLVLAADQNDNTPDSRALPASVVTVALTPEDAQRVTLATENGSFRLILRDGKDNTIDEKRLLKLSDLLKKPEKQEDKKVEEVVQVPVPEAAPESVWEPIAAPQLRVHVVWYRVGDRRWKEVFELDDNGDDATEGEQQGPVAQAPAPGPAPTAAPAPQPIPRSEAGRAKGAFGGF